MFHENWYSSKQLNDLSDLLSGIIPKSNRRVNTESSSASSGTNQNQTQK